MRITCSRRLSSWKRRQGYLDSRVGLIIGKDGRIVDLRRLSLLPSNGPTRVTCAHRLLSWRRRAYLVSLVGLVMGKGRRIINSRRRLLLPLSRSARVTCARRLSSRRQRIYIVGLLEGEIGCSMRRRRRAWLASNRYRSIPEGRCSSSRRW